MIGFFLEITDLNVPFYNNIGCCLNFLEYALIHHWRSFRSSYRKLAWVGFEPTTTEFRSDALTDWATRPWVQLALRANFVQLLQFYLFVQCSHFISVIAFVSRHICFKQNLAHIYILFKIILPILFATDLYHNMFKKLITMKSPHWSFSNLISHILDWLRSSPNFASNIKRFSDDFRGKRS